MPLGRCTWVILVALASAFPVAARAQAIACCNQHITVGGPWVGMVRPGNCQEYFNSAPTEVARKMCQQRSALACLNMERCKEFPPEEIAAPPLSGGNAALPPPGPDPDREGLTDGFGGGPPGSAPPGGLSPPRLVYLIKVVPRGGKPITAFTAWLDRAACPLPLDQNNRLADSASAKHVVRGKVIRRDGRVHIEAEAQERPGGAKIGPSTGEAAGEDMAAVATATRAVLQQMNLVCVR